jgi:orotidine-5'-phosphate decarboxylase
VNGKNSNGGLLINSSRGIIYASSDKNFAKDARQKAKELALETKPYTQHL